jgi:hypothetical protein
VQQFPLLIEFCPGTTLYREPAVAQTLPMVYNGPPGTFVIFPDGRRVPLPTDQIVHADDAFGSVRVAFGGMRFDGVAGGCPRRRPAGVAGRARLTYSADAREVRVRTSSVDSRTAATTTILPAAMGG